MVTDDQVKALLSDLAKSKLGHRQDFEDLIQQAVLDVLQRFPDLDAEQLARLAFVRLRWRLWERWRNEEAHNRLRHEHAADISRRHEFESDPRKDVEDRELRAEMLKVIVEVLTPIQRQIILGHFYRDESLSSIADALSMSRSTVSRQLAEAVSLVGRAMGLVEAR